MDGCVKEKINMWSSPVQATTRRPDERPMKQLVEEAFAYRIDQIPSKTLIGTNHMFAMDVCGLWSERACRSWNVHRLPPVQICALVGRFTPQEH